MGNAIKRGEISQSYIFKEKLGRGTFAKVRRAVRKKDRQEFAVKIIKKSKLNKQELAIVHDEVKIMHKIKDPNCAKLYEIFETGKKLYMVLELLRGGELFDRIVKKGSYSEREAAELTKKLAKAIAYLHSIGVVHRDLKPENLLYDTTADDAEIKITDFGLAKYRSEESTMTTACGTPGYVAPEVLKNQPYDSAVDMWSLGVILYILLCGFPPFYSESTQQLYQQIKNGAYDFPPPYWDSISADAKHLVKHLLQVDPRKRYTSEQVLKHPWVSEGQASTKALPSSALLNIRLLQAKRKLRRAVRYLMAINRFRALITQALNSASSRNLMAQAGSPKPE